MAFNFNPTEIYIYPAIELSESLFFRSARRLKAVLFFAAIAIFAFFMAGFAAGYYQDLFAARILGAAIIILSAAMLLWLADAFATFYLRRAPADLPDMEKVLADPDKHNLAEFLDFEPAVAAAKAVRATLGLKPPEVNSTLLFYFLLSGNEDLRFIFSRANLDFDNVKKLLDVRLAEMSPKAFSFKFWFREDVSFSNDFQQSILEAMKIASKHGKRRVDTGDMLTALARHNSIFRDILVQSDLKVDDIENLAWWLSSLKERTARARRFWAKENLAKRGTLAREWAAGYTINLDKYSTDWTDILRHSSFEELIGHKAEISAMERILSREGSNNHVLLVGEPGVGRHSIIHALTQRIMLGESLPNLNYKRVVELNVVSLISRTETLEATEALLDRIFAETISAGNVVLVINEFHNYIGGSARPGAIDISGALANYLRLTRFQIIGVTTYAGLHNNIEQNPSVLSLFEKVEVSELSAQELILVLEDAAIRLEQKYRRFVTYPALRKIIEMAARYIRETPFPKKAIDLLDDSMVYVSAHTKNSFVLPEHVDEVITQKTQIPVGELRAKEKETLLNLEALLHRRIINQEEAVSEVASAMRRARAEVEKRNGPMGTFLFLGPTGVGKTETAKALAQIYFGREERMVRLDMSEFQNTQDTARLLGSEGQDGLLTTPVRENPFSLLLLDEIEKAHPNILNLFLQVLDEGFITDGMGRKVDFDHTIIIATSNAGYQIILEAIEAQKAWADVKEKLLDYVFAEGIFRPEFINRFDAVVVFSPLTRENLLAIAGLQLRKIQEALADKNMEFVITEELKIKIADLGYDPKFGARKMKRVIQDKVQDPLAEALLADKIKKGDKVEVDPVSFSVKIK